MQNVQRAISALTPNSQSILEQAQALQAQVAELAEVITRADHNPGRALTNSGGAAALAKSIIRARHQRSRFLPPKLFSDPAWDILLELYAAEIAQRRMTVGQVCAGANVPATTGLRWLNTLEQTGLVERRADPFDARRFFVSLTQAGSEGMSAYLHSMQDDLLAA
jgi:DNA-binding MarR family transcriptional regulator